LNKEEIEKLKNAIKYFENQDVFVELKNAIQYYTTIRNAKIIVSNEKLIISNEKDIDLIIELHNLDRIEVNENSIFIEMTNEININLDF
jgi:predicted homoserine dehydrogenase-like protein